MQLAVLLLIRERADVLHLAREANDVNSPDTPTVVGRMPVLTLDDPDNRNALSSGCAKALIRHLREGHDLLNSRERIEGQSDGPAIVPADSTCASPGGPDD